MTMTSIEVPRGRTLRHDGKDYRPGELVELVDHEAAELIRIGAAILPGDPPPPPGRVVRPVSRAELDAMPPGPLPIYGDMAIGNRVYGRR
jgi:hypothetical protein